MVARLHGDGFPVPGTKRVPGRLGAAVPGTRWLLGYDLTIWGTSRGRAWDSTPSPRVFSTKKIKDVRLYKPLLLMKVCFEHSKSPLKMSKLGFKFSRSEILVWVEDSWNIIFGKRINHVHYTLFLKQTPHLFLVFLFLFLININMNIIKGLTTCLQSIILQPQLPITKLSYKVN